MRWIVTTVGDKAHIVGEGQTLCGIKLAHARGIVTPGVDDRCENCDHLWRREGKIMIRQAERKPNKLIYRHRFKFNDWDRRQ